MKARAALRKRRPPQLLRWRLPKSRPGPRTLRCASITAGNDGRCGSDGRHLGRVPDNVQECCSRTVGSGVHRRQRNGRDGSYPYPHPQTGYRQRLPGRSGASEAPHLKTTANMMTRNYSKRKVPAPRSGRGFGRTDRPSKVAACRRSRRRPLKEDQTNVAG